MVSKKRALILFLLALVSAILWFLIDFFDKGFQISDLGGPVLVIGIIGIPSFTWMIKKDKNK